MTIAVDCEVKNQTKPNIVFCLISLQIKEEDENTQALCRDLQTRVSEGKQERIQVGYCKTLKFGGYIYLALLAVKMKNAKI